MTDFDAAFPGLATIAHRVSFRILGDRADAEEVAQEALARAYARWSTVGGHAEPWVATVAANLAIGRWRRRRPTVPFSAQHGAAGGDAADAATLERLGLVTALRQLPRRQREVVVLRYLADLSEAAVAEQLSTSVGTVKQHAHRGLARLRAEMQEVDGVRAPG